MEQVTEEALSKGLDLLEALCSKIGVTVEHLWPYMIRQQIVEAIIPLVILIIGIALVFPYYKAFMKEPLMESCDITKRGIVMIIFGVALCILLLVSTLETLCQLDGLINPYYAAAKDLIRMVKP